MKTIVCVDDDRITLSFLKNTLSNDFKVVTTNNSDQAFELIVRLRPDLVITDIVMAEMSGFELSGLVKKVKGRENTPIIVLSSYDGPENQHQFVEGHLNLFLKKPVEPEILLSAVNGLIGR